MKRKNEIAERLPPISLSLAFVHIYAPSISCQVAEELRTKVLELYDFALSKDGRSVNYEGLAGSREYFSYVAASQELQRVRHTYLAI